MNNNHEIDTKQPKEKRKRRLIKKKRKVSPEKKKQENSVSETKPVELPSLTSFEKHSPADIDRLDVDNDKLDVDIDKSDVDINKSDVDIENDDKDNKERKETNAPEDYSSDNEIILMEDLWNSTKPMPMIESPISRSSSIPRKSSGGLESHTKKVLLEHLQVETPKSSIRRGGSTSNLLASPKTAEKKRGSLINLRGSGTNKQESASSQQFFWDDVKESNKEP